MSSGKACLLLAPHHIHTPHHHSAPPWVTPARVTPSLESCHCRAVPQREAQKADNPLVAALAERPLHLLHADDATGLRHTRGSERLHQWWVNVHWLTLMCHAHTAVPDCWRHPPLPGAAALQPAAADASPASPAAAPDSQNAQGFYRKNFYPLSECAVGPTKLKPMLAALKAAKLPPRRKSLLDVGWPRPPLRAKPPRKG